MTAAGSRRADKPANNPTFSTYVCSKIDSMKKLLLPIIAILFYTSCINEAAPPREKSPNYANGRVNQILVIADSSVWKSMPGDTFFYYFSAPYLLLPQPEPIFDIIHLTPEQLAKQTVKKEFRTILFLADMNDENSEVSALVKADVGEQKIEEVKKDKGYSTSIARDKWAKAQLLFYIYGFGEEKLAENIARNFPPIGRHINEEDMSIVKATAYQAGENYDLEAEVKAKFGLDLKIPGDFRKAIFNEKTNTLWLRRQSRDIEAGILIHKRPYKSKEQLTKAGIKAIRNEVGKLVSTHIANTYMRINDEDLPLFVENLTINARYTVQAKGIWDIVNDFMGGPFVSHLMVDPDKGELVFVDGFVYAPAEEKRNFMQEMEVIISTANF
jgi:hypothetical protein